MSMLDNKDGRSFFKMFIPSILILSLFSACLEKPLDPVNDNTPLGTVWKLNKNVDGLRRVAVACMESDSIALFHIQYNTDKSVLYWLSMKKGGDIELFSEIVSEGPAVPELSMEADDNIFYWTVNGRYLTDTDGSRIAVVDMSKPVSFYFNGTTICCRVKDSIVGEYPFTRSDYLAKDVAIDYDAEGRAFNLRLSSGYKAILPAISNYELLDAPVLNQAYYKDVFLDAGIGLDSMKSLPAATLLNLSLEGVAFPYSKYSVEDRDTQVAILSGDSRDSNGRLLYPDGQPRYGLLYIIGGDSKVHGQSLGEKGLKIMRTFVENGGCFVGSCAGAFLASNGFDGNKDYENYLSIWPGMIRHTGLRNTYTGMFIDKEGPLSRYSDFGGDHYVDSVRHNYGGYAEEMPVGTEVLARYDTPSRKSVHKTPSVWAYKASQRAGRIVMTGSHPEIVSDGERLDLTAAMVSYAMKGRGIAPLKGFLKNGEKREMVKTTEDNDPAFTRIGDLQVHHFAAYIPSDAKNIQLDLASPSKCDLALRMCQGTYAFPETAEFRTTASGPRQHLSFPSIREGFWFISVQCLSTVTVNKSDYGQEYVGNTEVLNGIPYHISISWE